MKKIILSLAIIAGFTASAFAQGKGEDCCTAKKKTCVVDKSKRNQPQSKKKNVKRANSTEKPFFADLNLTEDQKDKLQDMRKNHRKEMMELRASQIEEKKSILTSQQIAQLESRQNKKFEKRQETPSSVKFDEATEAKLKELGQELQEKRQAIKRSRIAPAMMEKKLQDLNEEYAKKRVDVVSKSYSKEK